MPNKLPTQDSVGKLFCDLLGKKVVVSPSPAYNPKPNEKFVLAVFIDDNNKPVALLLSDLNVACCLGSALTMLPAGVMKDAVKNQDIPANILENIKEITNIAVSLFNMPLCSHLRLGSSVIAPPMPSGPEAKGILAPRQRMDLKVDVPGYGDGFISLRLI